MSILSSSCDPSTGLTCLACRVVFATGELQKEHYRTDWHRYNLKRKIVGLPPVTLSQFDDKVAFFNGQAAVESEAAVQSDLYCNSCRKHFQSSKAFDNHLASKKHKEKTAKAKENVSIPRKDSKRVKVAQSQDKLSEIEEETVLPLDGALSDEFDDDDSEGWVTDHGTDDEDEYEYDESKVTYILPSDISPLF
ncbi:hypothetical protein AB6A40_009137 [Gnathostoma spinigerum]|uniref:C2H2-type domain-containing protein n=1 Tax=Gnathostoma spinigerum TaxID=75299 RepID=A0ABD6ERG2_9BILA